MSIDSIYSRLIAAGLSRAGACGLMGNMQAESAMRANIAQRGMTALTDEEYTRRADAGELDFACDAVGYGLCQWTFHTRKRALLDFARAYGTSVGDEKLQVEFCLRELRQDYPALSDFLRKTDSSYEAAARVCREYERPAQENISTRATYAQVFYNWYNDGSAGQGSAEETYWPPRMLCGGMAGADVACAQALMAARGQSCTPSGSFDDETLKCTRAFQSAHGLVPDGVIGAKTWAALLSERV